MEIENRRVLATPVSLLLTPQLATSADGVPASVSKFLIFLSCAQNINLLIMFPLLQIIQVEKTLEMKKNGVGMAN